MPQPFSLRDARVADLPAITGIYAHHVLHGTASFELHAPSLADMQQRHAAVSAAQLPYLVAEQHGTVLAYAYAAPYRPRPAYRFSVETSLYVHHQHAGLGLGRALMEAVIARCSAQGYRQMLAVVGDSQNHASLGLHQRLGFRQVGTFEAVGFKFGRWLDTVLMQRSLGDGASSLPEAQA